MNNRRIIVSAHSCTRAQVVHCIPSCGLARASDSRVLCCLHLDFVLVSASCSGDALRRRVSSCVLAVHAVAQLAKGAVAPGVRRAVRSEGERRLWPPEAAREAEGAHAARRGLEHRVPQQGHP